VSLQDEIDARRKEIKTESYSMSLGELSNLYVEGDLDIHPEFQRFYRWSEDQRSRLIESLLLGIPIPSIFVYQRKSDAVWDVIDGLQRLSTVFELMGVLKDENGNLMEPSRLRPTRYLPSLAGKAWEGQDGTDSLDEVQRRLIKRASLDLKIVSRESDPETPFELFQRLNSGGTQLSPQELRNALLIMVNRDFYFWLKELQEMEVFQVAVSPSDRAQEEQYDLELVLRFFALSEASDDRLRQIGDVTEFLTDTGVTMANDENLDKDRLRQEFRDTFEILAEALQDDSFRRYDAEKGRFLGNFSVSSFEAATAGVRRNLEGLKAMDNGERSEFVRDRVKSLWSDDRFRQNARGGVRASSRIPKIIPLGRDLFAG
jgi:Protein of unknown function DUF262